ncbi:MAG: hypothetical protein MUO77_20365 [Anaerolineales bacterium]|nr:hypothetical protein [Anaerolineales bacterium]
MLDGKTAVAVIERKFHEAGSFVKIPLQKGGMFTARLVDGGLEVTDLSSQPFLPWNVFEQTVDLMVRKGGRAERGDAMNSRLGEEGLPLDSIEGHIAHVVYGKQEGDSIFRRISPIAAILVWAGICDSAPGELIIR